MSGVEIEGEIAAATLVEQLCDRGLTIAVAESLTGGLVAAAITSVAGSSAVFRGSVTSYATDLKESILHVDADLLAERGPVDPDVARQMAYGVRHLLGADIGIATTGVAGPTEQGGKPVGLVYVAVCGLDDVAAVRELHLVGDRAAVRDQAVVEVLHLAVPEL